jgi:mRNA interferase RelE/StbE
VSLEILFEDRAISRAAEFLVDDPEGVKAILDTIDALADEPRPPGSFPFGSPDVRRFRVGRYRVVYEIRADTIAVGHIGRVSP